MPRPSIGAKIGEMSHRDDNHVERENAAPLTPGIRVVIGVLLPVAGGLTVAALLGQGTGPAAGFSRSATVVFLGPLALVSWFLGLRWFGLPGMGLRGRRPLFAGIGFAVLGWLAFLICRFIFVRIAGYSQPDASRTFIYLLLFEAFSVQIWVFGLLFRLLADWRGALTAALVGGLIFGAIASTYFQESYISGVTAYLYFVTWGILIGVIRLRTGSLLGTVLVQAVQSFTSWVVLAPFPLPVPAQLNSLYVASSIAYVVILWRLWPKRVEDYRI